MRSMFGATLPLAGARMYEVMTPRFAGTFLGLLEVILIPIPYIFYRRGQRIRASSPVIRQMHEEQAKNDRKRARGGGGGGGGATKDLRQRQERGGLGRGGGEGTAVVDGGAVGGPTGEAVVVGPMACCVNRDTNAVAALDSDADVEKGSAE
jgi:hypothetical protein